MRLSIIILTMGEKDRLLACLESLRHQLAEGTWQIILVDNSSTDGMDQLLRERFPQLRLIRNRSNVGVSRGRNQGIAAASSDYLLILDDDTIVQPGSLQAALEYMESHADVGVLGARLENRDGSTQMSCRRFPTLWIPLASRIPLLGRVPFMRRRLQQHLMTDFDHAQVAEVDYVLGAFQLLRRQVIDSVGTFDERIFFGPEDCDYALRCWRAGWRVVYFPPARVMHRHCRRTRRLGVLMLAHIKGMIWYFWKHRYLVSPPSHTLYRPVP